MNALRTKALQPLITFGKFVLLFCLGGLLTLCLSELPLAAQSANITQAQIIEIVSGDQVFIQNKPAKEKDIAKKQQRVSTGKARTELEFNNKAIARLGNDSSLTVGGCGAELAKGSVLLNGAVNGCTATISAGVRGTTYLLTIDEAGNEQVKVLEGEVEVVSRPVADPENDPKNDPDRPATNPEGDRISDQAENRDQDVVRTVVTSGQIFSIAPNSREFVVRNLSVDEFRAILEGTLFKGYRRELDSLDKIQRVFRNRFPGVKLPSLPQAPRRIIRWR
jgi:hypothetical protein